MPVISVDLRLVNQSVQFIADSKACGKIEKTHTLY